MFLSTQKGYSPKGPTYIKLEPFAQRSQN